ncbi:hypothetical protein ACFX2C_006290 [Malus domestica]
MAEGKWRSNDGRQLPPVSMNLVVGKRPRSDYEIALYFLDRSCSYFEKIGLMLILALVSLEAINSTSSVTQTLSSEVADVNPLVTQLTNGPLGGLHEKWECVKCVDADDGTEFGDTPLLAEQVTELLPTQI